MRPANRRNSDQIDGAGRVAAPLGSTNVNLTLVSYRLFFGTVHERIARAEDTTGKTSTTHDRRHGLPSLIHLGCGEFELHLPGQPDA